MLTATRNRSLLIVVFLSALSLIFFQNCGSGEFQATLPGDESVQYEDLSYLGTTDLSESGNGIEQPSLLNGGENANEEGMPSAAEAAAALSLDGKPLRLNFAAGSQEACEKSVEKKLGQNLSCFVGGGCGVSCGIPGSNCQSSHPELFGLCIETSAEGLVEAKTIPEEIPYPEIATPADQSTLCKSIKFPIPHDAAQVDLFVSAAYCNILEREPEEDGRIYWRDTVIGDDQTNRAAALLNIAISLEAIGVHEIHKKTHREYVNYLYEVFLGRTAEMEGMEFWTNALEDVGGNRILFTRLFLENPDVQARWGIVESLEPETGSGSPGGGSSGGSGAIQ